MRSRFAGLGIAATVALVGAVGCGSAGDKLAETAAERAMRSATGGDVDFDLHGDGGMTIKGPDGEEMRFDVEDGSYSVKGADGETTFETGGSAQIPDDWPAELTLPSANVEAVTNQSSDGSRSSTVILTVDGSSVTDVVGTLKAQLEATGHDISGESSMSGEGFDMAGFVATDGAVEISVNAMFNDGDTTRLTISRQGG